MAKPRDGKRRHGDVDLLVALVLGAMFEDDGPPPAGKPTEPRPPAGKGGGVKTGS